MVTVMENGRNNKNITSRTNQCDLSICKLFVYTRKLNCYFNLAFELSFVTISCNNWFIPATFRCNGLYQIINFKVSKIWNALAEIKNSIITIKVVIYKVQWGEIDKSGIIKVYKYTSPFIDTDKTIELPFA